METSNVSYVVLNLIRIDIRKNYYFLTLRKYSGIVLFLNSRVIGSLGCYKMFLHRDGKTNISRSHVSHVERVVSLTPTRAL